MDVVILVLLRCAFFLFVCAWHLAALKTKSGKDDVKTPRRHTFTKLKIYL